MKRGLSPKKNIKIESYISMENIEEISTSAALVLAAEYERKFHFMDEPAPIFDLENWDSGTLYKLFQIGFFERFGYQVSNSWKSGQSKDIMTIPFYSGSKAEMEKYDNKLKALVEHIDPNFELPNSMRLGLNSAIGEAANNAREHAYFVHDFKYPHVNRWWATGAASKDERTLVDAKMIQAATRFGKSGRENQTGGYGLPQIKDAIRICGEGSLMILSRGGKYLYSVSEGKEEETLDCFSASVGGTLIEWRVRLPKG